MKKILAFLAVLCLMVPAALATGRVIDDSFADVEYAEVVAPVEAALLEVSGCLGMTRDALEAHLQENGAEDYSDIFKKDSVAGASGETEEIVSSIEMHDLEKWIENPGVCIMGFYIGGSFEGMDEVLIAKGWEQVSQWYEGGTLDWTFSRKIGGATYTFRVWSDSMGDNDISYLSLTVDDMAAHYANEEAGLDLLPTDEAAE